MNGTGVHNMNGVLLIEFGNPRLLIFPTCYRIQSNLVITWWKGRDILGLSKIFSGVCWQSFTDISGTTYRSHFSSEVGTDRLSRKVANNYQHILRNNPYEQKTHKAKEFRNYDNETELRIICDDVKRNELEKFYKRRAFMKVAIYLGSS